MENTLRVALPRRGSGGPAERARRPPTWLIISTAALTLSCLAMAVAETTLWMHYLIDQGEYVSLGGLVFILVAGLYLYRRGQLRVSLPLVLPWLLYPIITQGDQLIDNLTINQMRVVCQVLLALLFGAPVAVFVLTAEYLLAPATPRTLAPRHWTTFVPGLRALAEGRTRSGRGLLAATLFVAEIWIANRFLGTLMVGTLIGLAVAAFTYGMVSATRQRDDRPVSREGFALVALVIGVSLSFGIYLGYKNRPGAYQGSPAYFMDPAQRDAEYPLQRIAVPAVSPQLPPPHVAAAAQAALTGYGRSLQQLVDGYYIADRNYNYAFHNALFLRHTPVLPQFRRVALDTIAGAGRVAASADLAEAAVEPLLAPGDPLRAFLAEVRAYVAFNFRRAAILEAKTAEFERTQAGLQHATHIYEGEAKILGIRLMDINQKHHAVTSAAAMTSITSDFLRASRAVHDKYANRIVGF